MKILFLSRWFPFPPDNGSKIRIYNLLQHLAARHQVDLISFYGQEPAEESLRELSSLCEKVEVVPHQPFQASGLKALFGFFSVRPRAYLDMYSAEMANRVRVAVRESDYDVVIASQIDMAPYVQGLNGAVKILEELELTTIYETFAQQQEMVKRVRYGLTWWKTSRYVARLLMDSQACTVVSDVEQRRLNQVAPNYQRTWIIPNGVDMAYYAGDFGTPRLDTLVYSGSLTYGANFDAIEFFLREVYPLIQACRPQVRLIITGKLDGVPVERLPQRKGVVFTGFLPDVRPTIARSWVSVVPLRYGGGTRLKILEALALGVPVVTTYKGMEGLDLSPGEDLLAADEPQAFAEAVVQLLERKGLRQQISQNGKKTVARKYDWQKIGPYFCDFVEEIAGVEK